MNPVLAVTKLLVARPNPITVNFFTCIAIHIYREHVIGCTAAYEGIIRESVDSLCRDATDKNNLAG